jgi:hypothetical protein
MGQKSRRATDFQRSKPTRKTIPAILIVTEGEKTEPYYFKGFYQPGVLAITVEGTGFQPDALIRRAERLNSNGTYRQVWCVFDRDRIPGDSKKDGRFNTAIAMAQAKGFHVAYSNDSFELWYVLHFQYLTSANGRAWCMNFLENQIDYEKNQSNMYELLLSHQAIAISNASRLHQSYGNSGTPASNEPCTTVYLLVNELNRLRNQVP